MLFQRNVFDNNRHFPKLNYVNFYFHKNEAGLDKQTKDTSN